MYALAAAVWAAVMFAVVIAVKGAPVYGAVVLHDATFELYVAVAVTAMVSAVIGLALSALGKSLGEVLPLLVPVILAAVLFNGSLVQLVSMWGLQQISWLVPARWGFAASASTVNLRRIDPLAANAETWTHYSGWWVFDMVMLVLFGVAAAGLTSTGCAHPGRSVRRHELSSLFRRRDAHVTVGSWRQKRQAQPNICATHWTGVGVTSETGCGRR